MHLKHECVSVDKSVRSNIDIIENGSDEKDKKKMNERNNLIMNEESIVAATQLYFN